jgi:histone H1/5
MAEAAAEVVSTEKSAPSPKKGKAAKAKKPRTTPSHPKTSDMVNAAITNLKERGGSSLQAIKKYVGATYKVDVEKLSPFIKKYLKSAVASGSLVQTKGKGASGSFKLSTSSGKSEKKAEGKKKKTKKASSPKKTTAAAAGKTKASPAKKSKPSSAAKTAKPKKKSAAKPAAAKKAPAASGEKKKKAPASKARKAAKSPKKEKKAKAPKKPKSPKPKKASAKKAAAKK